MSWFAQESQALGKFLQGHVAFDVALGIVVAMLMLSVVFSLINRPTKAVASLKSTLVDLKEDQVKVLWEYALHSDNLFNDRQNFFLFFESILLGGTFAVIATTSQISSDTLNLVLLVAAFLGLLITVSWWYLQVRQAYVLHCMVQSSKIVIPAYRDVIFPIRQKPYHVGSILILANILPMLVAFLWAAILLYV